VNDDLKHLTRAVVAFRDERDWKQFHHPKELVGALAIEAAELMEVLRFKSQAEVDAQMPALRARLGEELADCLFFVLLLAHDCGIDLAEALPAKLQANARKYPVELARGRNEKYTELGGT
jgi:dCTP diphosphatase